MSATRIALVVALLLAPAAIAPAQDTTATATSSASPPVRMPWPAPVGHRQPRPADIAAARPEKDAYDVELERLNRAADATLRICRGC
jgi:hypothetical protein